jgi:hypothetical protein
MKILYSSPIILSLTLPLVLLQNWPDGFIVKESGGQTLTQGAKDERRGIDSFAQQGEVIA